jgi:AcrR family transcriptional regulator
MPQYPSEALCRRILEANAATISVQKEALAVRRLQTILGAALRLSAESGFHAMSLRALSREAGVSMGGLYAYFDSKTTLLRMILQAVTRAVEETLSAPPEGLAADPAAQLDWLIESHIRLTESMLPWFTFAFMEAKSFPRDLRRMATDSEALTERYIAEICTRAVAAGQFRADLSPIVPTLVKPLLQDWYVKRTKYRRRGITIEAYIATVQDSVRRICR